MAKKNQSVEKLKEKEDGNPSDVQTIDDIIKAFYESISFVSGKQPDYKRLRFLFHPQGQLIPNKEKKDTSSQVMDLDMFIKQSVEHIVLTGIERKGMVSNEIARRTQSFSNIAHSFSTFETKQSLNDTNLIQRGIYSIQLIRDHHRWYIFSVIWGHEKPGTPLPQAYLV